MAKDVAVVQAGGLLDRYKQGINPFLDDAGSDDYFGTFLKFSGNSGEFNYGDSYAEELVPGSEVLIDLENAQHGWICWVEGEVMAEQNFLISSGKTLPKESELEDFGPYATNSDGTKDGWQEQYIFHLYSEKEEEAFTLKLSSTSARRSAQKLVREYGKVYGIKVGDDGLIQVPLVEIDSNSFDVKDKETGKINKKAGKKFAPVFKIVEWVDRTEIADLFEAGGDDEGDYGDDDEPEVAPVKEKAAGTRRAAAPEKEDKPARGARRSREEAPAEEAPADDDQQEEAAAEAPATGGRRARVTHGTPQDDDDAGDKPAEEGRASARGRRGRSR